MKTFIVLGLLLVQTAFTADIPSDPHIYDAPGPHGGKIVRVKKRSFEVSRKATQKMLDVYVLKADGAPPKNLQMTLLKSGKTDQRLDLKAVPSTPDDQYYHYQAVPTDTNVVPNEESQAAFGFTFDLDSTKK